MIPGEIFPAAGEIILNEGRSVIEVDVGNHGDRPIQVGSHFHFFEANRALVFDRTRAFGFRLDISAGTSLRFEPGEDRTVRLVSLAGRRIVRGLNGLTDGRLDDPDIKERALERARYRGF